jgi:hypothetical protein
MKSNTTAIPPVTTTDSEATRADKTTDGNANSGREKTAAKGETTTALTPSPSTTATESARPIAESTGNVDKNPADADMLSRLRISQDFGSKSGTRKLVTTIPIRPPKKNEFIRVHSTMLAMLVWTLTDEQLVYVVTNDIADTIPGLVVAKELVPSITRQGTLFLWPLRIPGEHGRTDNWLTSAKEAATHSVHAWVRVQANMDLGAFEIFEAMGAIPEPEWPRLSMDEIVRIAVKGRVIDSLDHPVLKKLRGEE